MMLSAGIQACDVNITSINNLEKIIEPQLIRKTFDDIFKTHPYFSNKNKIDSMPYLRAEYVNTDDFITYHCESLKLIYINIGIKPIYIKQSLIKLLQKIYNEHNNIIDLTKDMASDEIIFEGKEL